MKLSHKKMIKKITQNKRNCNNKNKDVARVQRCNDLPFESGLSGMMWVKRIRNSCFLSIKKKRIRVSFSHFDH
jgi:hypothetical protein